MKKSISENLIPVLFLTIVVCVSAIALTITNSITKDRIEEKKDEEIQNKLKDLFPSMKNYEYDDDTEIYTIYQDIDVLGYAFVAKGSGYGGEIEILVGLRDTETIEGIKIISHSETPGLGDKITQDSFTEQFIGVDISKVKLKEDGGEVDAITGATISSSSVVEIVRKAAEDKSKLIEE